MLTVPLPATVKKFYKTEAKEMEVSMSAIVRQVLRQHAINQLEARGDKEGAAKLRGGKAK